ncbi:MAG: transglycosylase SLT domain-containing protein [Aminivibrio sp.]|jgi:soluble lytic murein transglycosylase-like protein
MKKILIKSVAAIMILSAAGFILMAVGGRRTPSFPLDGAEDTTGPAENLLADLALDLAGPHLEAADLSAGVKKAAITSFAETAKNIASLSGFIRSQNREVSLESSLIQANAFLKSSLKYGVPLDLIVAVANTESHFRPEAKSGAGAAGVMQVVWKVHSGLLQANGIAREEDLHDPEMGIAAGSLLLSRYIKASGDLKTALGRYYGGSADVYWERVSRNLSKFRNAKLFASSQGRP